MRRGGNATAVRGRARGTDSGGTWPLIAESVTRADRDSLGYARTPATAVGLASRSGATRSPSGTQGDPNVKEEQRQRVLELLIQSPHEEEQEEREALEAPVVPLDAELRERLVAAALQRPESLASGALEGTPASETVKKDELAARRHGRRWKVAGAITSFAAAAAAVLVLRGALVAPVSVGEVPTYKLRVTGSSDVLGVAAVPATAPAHLVSGGMLRVDLRPSRAPTGEVDVQPYLWQREQGGPGGQLVRLSTQLHRTEQGVFLLSVPVSDVPELRSGTSEFLFIVGRKGGLPSDAEVSRIANGGVTPTAADWQLLRQVIVFEP